MTIVGKYGDMNETRDMRALPVGCFRLAGILFLLASLAQSGCCLVCMPEKDYDTPENAVRALGRAWAARDYRAMLSCLDDHSRWQLCRVVRAKSAFDREADMLKEAIREHCGPEGVVAYESLLIQGSADSLFVSCFGWPRDGDPSGHLRTVVEQRLAYIYLDKEMLGLTAGRTGEGWVVLPPWYPEFRGVGQIAAMIDHSRAKVRSAVLRVKSGVVDIEDIPGLLPD